MLLRTRLESLPPLQCQGDFTGWYTLLLHNAMRDNDGGSAVKEVEHSIVNPLAACPQFVNAIAEVVCFRSSQIVTYRLQTLKTNLAFPLCLRRKLVQPADQRHLVLIFLEVEDLNGRQAASLMFSLLITEIKTHCTTGRAYSP